MTDHRENFKLFIQNTLGGESGKLFQVLKLTRMKYASFYIYGVKMSFGITREGAG
jgi:hypothetical protein